MSRVYSSTSVATTLASSLSSTATSMTVTTGGGGPLIQGAGFANGDIFTIAIDPDTQTEEICYVVANSGDTFTIQREKAGTSGVAHASGATVRHVLTSADLTAFAAGISPVANLGFSGSASGTTTVQAAAAAGTNTLTLPATSNDTLVGKATTDTLTNKTLTSPVLTTPSISNINAKGDILIGTADNTLGVLTVGANGTTLVADSAEATGLKWQTPTVYMTNPLTTTGDTIYSSSGTTPARLGIGTAGQVLTVNGGATAPSWATPVSSITSASSNVDTIQATSSTSYTDLNTVQSVTLTTGTKVLVFLTAEMQNAGSTNMWTSVEISGASSVAADDKYSIEWRATPTNIPWRFSAHRYFTGLTAGSNVFTMKFKSSGGNTGNWGYRTLTVIDLGS